MVLLAAPVSQCVEARGGGGSLLSTLTCTLACCWALCGSDDIQTGKQPDHISPMLCVGVFCGCVFVHVLRRGGATSVADLHPSPPQFGRGGVEQLGVTGKGGGC